MRDTVISILITAVFLCGLFIMTVSILFRAVKGVAIINIETPGTYIIQTMKEVPVGGNLTNKPPVINPAKK